MTIITSFDDTKIKSVKSNGLFRNDESHGFRNFSLITGALLSSYVGIKAYNTPELNSVNFSKEFVYQTVLDDFNSLKSLADFETIWAKPEQITKSTDLSEISIIDRNNPKIADQLEKLSNYGNLELTSLSQSSLDVEAPLNNIYIPENETYVNVYNRFISGLFSQINSDLPEINIFDKDKPEIADQLTKLSNYDNLESTSLPLSSLDLETPLNDVYVPEIETYENLYGNLISELFPKINFNLPDYLDFNQTDSFVPFNSLLDKQEFNYKLDSKIGDSGLDSETISQQDLPILSNPLDEFSLKSNYVPTNSRVVNPVNKKVEKTIESPVIKVTYEICNGNPVHLEGNNNLSNLNSSKLENMLNLGFESVYGDKSECSFTNDWNVKFNSLISDLRNGDLLTKSEYGHLKKKSDSIYSILQ